MHVRARLHRRRTQISLLDTRRVDGKVRQEHIASVGSFPSEMTPADRLAFWTQVHGCRRPPLHSLPPSHTQPPTAGNIKLSRVS
jgi:hypothetical protein